MSGWTEDVLAAHPELAATLAMRAGATPQFKADVWAAFMTRSAHNSRPFFKAYRSTLPKAAQIEATQKQKDLLLAIPTRDAAANAWLAEISTDFVALQLDQLAMKPVLSLLTIICLVVPAAGQTADPTSTDPTVAALTALLTLKEQAKFGAFLKANHERTKFADFLGAQGRFALLANKEALLHAKTEADRPNYGGNAAACYPQQPLALDPPKKVKPSTDTPATPPD